MRVKVGDIIGFSGCAWDSDLINMATYGIPRWSLSHVGIIAKNPLTGKLLVYESNEHCPLRCAITKTYHDGVQAHSLKTLLKKYHGKVWLYRVNCYVDDGYLGSVTSLSDYAFDHIGVPYDWEGAKQSGGKLVSAIKSIFGRADTSRLFCSEFVAELLDAFGIFPVKNVSAWSPNRMMRRLTRRGLYDKAVRLK